jgi:hypothetical protein
LAALTATPPPDRTEGLGDLALVRVSAVPPQEGPEEQMQPADAEGIEELLAEKPRIDIVSDRSVADLGIPGPDALRAYSAV